ncbi:hypothetical protein niasHT_030718 [Heterodera trifolii]|uniref:Uncharacterized protein n=1 Tax=Heterodera trifolii TaxID=157864 RepID=A0ABD2HQI5_9BILA
MNLSEKSPPIKISCPTLSVPVIECARVGHKSCVGVELNYPLVIASRFSAWRKGFSNSANFVRGDIFKTDLSKYNTAILFGTESLVDHFAPKLNEMRTDSNLVLCRFPLRSDESGWELRHSEGVGCDQAWLYRRTGKQ